jgi:hypothetical protein
MTSSAPVSSTSMTSASKPPPNTGLHLPRLLLPRTWRLRWRRLSLPL